MTDHIPDATKKVGRPQIREAFLRNGAHIEPGHDDLPDYVYESVFELLEMTAPAVQGEPIPAGFALIKLDSRTGKPLVTSEMKAKHIGEYWWDEEAPYYDEHGELHDYVARHAVPWSLCKEIYKNMASTAMLSAQPAEQQPAPDVEALVEALEGILAVVERVDSWESFPSDPIEIAETALAAYRKGGDHV